MMFNDLIDSICGTCGREVSLTELSVQVDNAYSQSFRVSDFKVFICPRCRSGSVLNLKPEHREGLIEMDIDLVLRSPHASADQFVLSPGPFPMPKVSNLPDDVDRAWDEVLNAGRANAWTAAELMCRKILMHVAVDQFDMKEGLAFAAYVQKLDDERFFPRMMMTVVNGIRERGNRATHDLASTSPEQATKTLKITHYVLRTIYELSE